MNTSEDLTTEMEIKGNIKHEVHDEASTIVLVNSSCDVQHIYIKEEVLPVEPDTYVDISKDLSFEVEMKEDIQLKDFNESSSTFSADSTCGLYKIKDEFSPAESDTYVKQEISKVPSFSFQLKLKHFNEKREDDTTLQSLENQEVDIKSETQSNDVEATITKCTGSKSPHSSTCNYKCSQKCNSLQDMNNHNGKKRFKCKMCDYKSLWNSDIQKHMKIHTGEKPFQCKICDFKCSQNSNLRRHMHLHTGEKPYQCNLCDFKSSDKSNLRQHNMQVHSGEKPFQCNVCDFKFSLKSNLLRHMQIHNGEKPFQCNICDFKCSQNSSLQRHLQMHTGEKPFQCTVCDFRSSDKSYLRKHMKIHTGEKPFQCSVCSYKFSRKSHLQRHMEIHKYYKITSSE